MDSNALYPLEFIPQLHYRLWGGEQLRTLLGKKEALRSCGESWEISALEGKVSIVSKGALKGQSLKALIEKSPAAILGKRVIESYGKNFPLLIKFIDAQQPLSVQVHPNNVLAQERHNCWGKSEMWYIIKADKSAKLTLGFNESIDAKSFKNHCEEKSLESVLLQQQVSKGDVVHIPAGLLHAIGGGIVLAEIQQASDITYRVYDYDRIDAKKGKARKLHHKEALGAIDFSLEKGLVDYEPMANGSVELINSPYFTTHLIQLEGGGVSNKGERNAFEVLIGVEGSCKLHHQGNTYTIGLGDCFLLPAAMSEYELSGKGRMLSVTV